MADAELRVTAGPVPRVVSLPPSTATLLTVREVTRGLGVHRVTVYRLCERGELAHLRVCNAIRVLPWRPTSGEAHPDQPGGPTVAPAVRSRPNHFNEAQFGPGGSACQWGPVRATRHSAVLRYLSTVGLSRWTSSSRGRETRTGTAMMYRPIAAPSRCEAARVTPRRISSGILDPPSFPK